MTSRIARASDSIWNTAAGPSDDIEHLDFTPHPYEEGAGDREELRRKLPPGAMRDEPGSDAERRDLYWHGDGLLHDYMSETKKNLDLVHNWRKNENKKLYRLWDESGFSPGEPIVEGMAPKKTEIHPGVYRVEPDLPENVRKYLQHRGGPGDSLIGNGNEESEGDDVERDRYGYKPDFHRVWNEQGDYLGGSFDEGRAEDIMRGHILNHLWETRDDDLPNWHHTPASEHDGGRFGPYCAGCGIYTSPHYHGFSIQTVPDEDPQPPKDEDDEEHGWR